MPSRLSILFGTTRYFISPHAGIVNQTKVQEPPPMPEAPHLSTMDLPASPSDSTPTAGSSTIPSSIDPPIPAYSPRAPDHGEMIQIANPVLDAEMMRYSSAHGHAGVAVAPRAPEVYHSDRLSFRSDETVEPLPAYGADAPPRYRRPFENREEEPQTLAMHFFKFGFCERAQVIIPVILLNLPST